MTRQQREELNRLSKEVFGTSSKWQKLVNDGFAEPFERNREVLIPTKKGIEKKVFTDKKSVIRHYTVEEVHTIMKDLLKQKQSSLSVQKNTALDELAIETESLGIEFK